ncbi:DUF4439 domain-containing protein [Nocardioides jishulii]|uniref:DUF4439 domain-containing protein n=1 Tax=Nocardioides jishulii TaxID=2575440 RepID=A0A4U2YL97_9ACTN|nr:DUF4439 domain-containing protein [Nocardioides jishulii]QCX27082.1 DUF4439 domain-containing protein [Nocardioides jishulii]TKI61564.1 DUF4439 domain-containing protein [Nocardioides jishulii]
MSTSASQVEALQDTLAAEHAAVQLLGAFGGALSATADPGLHLLLVARHRRHRERREFLTVTLRGLGETPVPAAAAYALPDDLGDPVVVREEGARTEDRCLQRYATLVAASTAELRAWAIEALAESAGALVSWGNPPTAFPGAPELQD